ncbi:MAG: helix-turn-helix domain-containing protein [Acidobacteria bacterium]|nr:helix-turn-helix domain-containing protein [Acidobacteriota bacterium]
MNPDDRAERLESWKQIAAYLGKSERTVRRWQQVEGLPVHRHQHQQRGSVWAFPQELDAWLESRRRSPELLSDAPAPLQRSWRIVVPLAALLINGRRLVFLVHTS